MKETFTYDELEKMADSEFELMCSTDAVKSKEFFDSDEEKRRFEETYGSSVRKLLIWSLKEVPPEADIEGNISLADLQDRYSALRALLCFPFRKAIFTPKSANSRYNYVGPSKYGRLIQGNFDKADRNKFMLDPTQQHGTILLRIGNDSINRVVVPTRHAYHFLVRLWYLFGGSIPDGVGGMKALPIDIDPSTSESREKTLEDICTLFRDHYGLHSRSTYDEGFDEGIDIHIFKFMETAHWVVPLFGRLYERNREYLNFGVPGDRDSIPELANNIDTIVDYIMTTKNLKVEANMALYLSEAEESPRHIEKPFFESDSEDLISPQKEPEGNTCPASAEAKSKLLATATSSPKDRLMAVSESDPLALIEKELARMPDKTAMAVVQLQEENPNMNLIVNHLLTEQAELRQEQAELRQKQKNGEYTMYKMKNQMSHIGGQMTELVGDMNVLSSHWAKLGVNDWKEKNRKRSEIFYLNEQLTEVQTKGSDGDGAGETLGKYLLLIPEGEGKSCGDQVEVKVCLPSDQVFLVDRSKLVSWEYDRHKVIEPKSSAGRFLKGIIKIDCIGDGYVIECVDDVCHTYLKADPNSL